MAESERTFKRAAAAALIGLITQLVLAVVIALLGIYAKSSAIHAATWHLVGGLPIWIALWVLFNQHRLERTEALEAEQLAEDDAQAAALFQEAGQQLALARKRLDNLYKWGLNIVGLAVALYLVTVGTILFYLNYQRITVGEAIAQAVEAAAGVQASALLSPTANLGLLIMLLLAMAFIAFLIARYIAGMTEVRQWLALRAGAAYLMGNALVLALLVAAAVGAMLGNAIGFAILAVVVPGVMVLLGIEVLFGLLFGLYRPRKPDEFVRPAFDSRILGWLTRPESLGKIVTDTINYQFGFEISRSWFYRLLSQATLPLALMCVLFVIAMSSVVFVAPQQNAVVTRFGELERIVGPGIHFKWPWPLGRAQKEDVNRVHQLVLGSRMDKAIEDAAMLWTNVHTEGGKEDYLITAPTLTEADQIKTDIAAGELIGADVVISYRIADLKQFVNGALDPKAMLTALAEEQVNAHFAARNIDALLTTGRIDSGGELLEAIRGAVRREQIGIDVLLVTVSSVHPPQESEVAKSFHEQIGALQEKQSAIQTAEKDAIEMLAEVAGTRDKALRISEAIEQLDGLIQQPEVDDKQVAEKAAEIEALLVDEAGGQAAVRLHEARARRWSTAIAELARAEAFASELTAYRQAPRYYRARLYFNTIAEAMKDRRKIILDLPPGREPTIRMDLKQGATPLEEFFQADQ